MDRRNGRFINGVYYPEYPPRNAPMNGQMHQGNGQMNGRQNINTASRSTVSQVGHPHAENAVSKEGYCGGTEGHSVFPFGSAGIPQGKEGMPSAPPRAVKTENQQICTEKVGNAGGAKLTPSELRSGFKISVIIGEPRCRQNRMVTVGHRREH